MDSKIIRELVHIIGGSNDMYDSEVVGFLNYVLGSDFSLSELYSIDHFPPAQIQELIALLDHYRFISELISLYSSSGIKFSARFI